MKAIRGDLPVITRALLARCIFVAHSVIAVWQMVEVSGKTAYWSLTVIALCIFIEGMLVIISCEGQEAKWFCTSVFLYLCSIVPPIWYLQLDLSIWSKNTSSREVKEHKTMIETTLHVSRERWIQILEQTLLVILIIGRWMLPKGDITREQLSQILLAYLAIASDIVELFDMFKEPAPNTTPHIPYVILVAWTLSLLQFPFVLTTSKARKMRVAITTVNSDEEVKRLHYMAKCEAKSRPKWMQILADTDVWAIVLALSLQDIPFVLVRLYLMIEYHVMSYTMIFFTSKNVLVFMLQIYRLAVLIQERYHKNKIEADAHRLMNHYRHMLDSCKDILHKIKDESVNQVSNMKNRGKNNRRPPGKRGGGGYYGIKKKRVHQSDKIQEEHEHDTDDLQAGGSGVHLLRRNVPRKRTSFQEEEEIIQIELSHLREHGDDDEDGDVVFSPEMAKTTVAQLESNDNEQLLRHEDTIFSPSTVRRHTQNHHNQKLKGEPIDSTLSTTITDDRKIPLAMREVDEFGSETNTASLGGGDDSDPISDIDRSARLSSSKADQSQATSNFDDETVSSKNMT